MTISYMGWLVFDLSIWFIALLLVPLRNWKRSYVIGLAGMLIVLAIDSKLIVLGAFRYYHNGTFIYGLPLPYWLAYFPGGIFFDYFRPKSNLWRILYIFIFSALYLVIELIMKKLGYFIHLNWTVLNSYILNLFGFTVSMWIAEWWEAQK
jgi:hypothetical protein